MLSNRDRDTLRAIQHQLAIDDPEFVRRFDDRELPSTADRAEHRRQRALTMALWAGGILGGLVLLLLQSPSGLVLIALVGAVAVGREAARRNAEAAAPPEDRNRSTGPPRRGDPS